LAKGKAGMSPMKIGAIAGCVLILSGVGVVAGLAPHWAYYPVMSGTYLSNFGSYITVTENEWIDVSPWGRSYYSILSSDNGGSGVGIIIMQTHAAAAYFPSKWNKVEYHEIAGGGLAYCTTVYDADSSQAALDADTSAIYNQDDEAAGCDGFPFTEMSPYAFPLAGTWTDNYGATLTLDGTTWESSATYGDSLFHVVAYGDNFVLMQNDADAAYYANKWTKLEFVSITEAGSGTSAGDFTYCSTVYDGETAEAALLSDTSGFYNTADISAGCNGFPHSIASPA
jgi:hypothetical protein